MTRVEAPITVHKASWAPMVALALAQVLMSFNVASLPVSLGGMVKDFNVPPTAVSTGIVTYGLVVAALVMTGAKLGQKFGWVLVFRIVIVIFGIAMTLMTFAPNVGVMITAQALAGGSAAIIVPSLVALIAENYHGDQQATAVGSLGSARAASGVSAFLIGGILGTFIGWRPVFGILIGFAVIVFILSFRLKAAPGNSAVKIDIVGAALIGLGVVSLTLGFNNLNSWGVVFAEPSAPFDILGLSPAPFLVVIGVILGQGFFVWTRRRTRREKTPLISLTVVGSKRERAAVYALFLIVGLEASLNFTIPLYIQIVQGRTPLATSIAMLPFNLTVFFSALVVIRFYKRFSTRTIARFAFILTTVALLWLSLVVTNNWETFPTIIGLFVFGVGPGRARDAAVQRAGHVVAEGAGGGCRIPPRHHPEPRIGRRHGARRRDAGDPAGPRVRPGAGQRPRHPGLASRRGWPQQRELREQHGAQVDAREDLGDARAGGETGVDQRGLPPARAADRAARAGGHQRHRHPAGQPAAALPPRRDPRAARSPEPVTHNDDEDI